MNYLNKRSEEFHNLYHSQNHIKKNEIGRTRSAHVQDEKYGNILVEKSEEKEHLNDLGVDGRIILK